MTDFYAAPEEVGPEQRVGFTGLRRLGGTIYEDPSPELRGRPGIELYTEMGTDPMCGAMIQALTLMARQVTWSCTPADDSPLAAEIAAHVESCLWDLGTQTWEGVISSIFGFLQYGWSWHELTYKRRLGPTPGGRQAPSKYNDGRWGLASVEERGQDSLYAWLYGTGDDADTLLGIAQQHPIDGRVARISVERSLHCVTRATKGNPEGLSILRNAVKPWHYKRRLEELEAVGIERDLVGIPIAEVPAPMLSRSASPDQIDMVRRIKRSVRNLRRNESEGLLWPRELDDQGNEKYVIRLLSTGGTRQFDIDKSIARYDARILLVGLTDFLLLGHEGTSGLGVTSIGASKVDLLNAALEALVDAVAAEATAKIATTITLLNGWPGALAPYITHGRVDPIDLPALAEYILKLSQAGLPMFPAPELEQYLHQVADLPYDIEAAQALAEQTAAAVSAASAARVAPTEPANEPTLMDRANALGQLIRSGADPESAAARTGWTGLEFTGAIPVTLRPTEDVAVTLEGGASTAATPPPAGTEPGTPPDTQQTQETPT